MWWSLIWSLGCQSTLSGQVVDGALQPVAGAVLEAPGCRAVTDAAGRYKARCAPGGYRFAVRHPAHLEAELEVRTGRGSAQLPTLQLAAVPTEGGLYAQVTGGFAAIPPGTLVRTDEPGAMRYCAQGEPTPVASARWLDVHSADLRIFAVDPEGCFYRMKELRPGVWGGEGREVKPEAVEPGSGTEGGTEGGPGTRRWIRHGLAPGRYAVIATLDGIFVTEDAGDRRYYGWYVEISL